MPSEQPKVPGVFRDRGRGDLERIVIDTDLAQAEIYLHGAHVTHFHPRGSGRTVLWMSQSSLFQLDKPIRGGVPICFPWFGPNTSNAKAPAHGFARTSTWAVESIRSDESGAVSVCLTLTSSDQTRRWWQGEFEARYVVTVARDLRLELTVRNLGRGPIQFEQALHSYFAVSDVRHVEVHGLENGSYLDRLKPGQRFKQNDKPINFIAETDRTYVGTENTVTVVDPGFGRRIINRKTGSQSTVVWNPWIDKAKAMPDFGDDEWPGMLCIETANAADNAITLAPGASHCVSATISVEDIG